MTPHWARASQKVHADRAPIHHDSAKIGFIMTKTQWLHTIPKARRECTRNMGRMAINTPGYSGPNDRDMVQAAAPASYLPRKSRKSQVLWHKKRAHTTFCTCTCRCAQMGMHMPASSESAKRALWAAAHRRKARGIVAFELSSSFCAVGGSWRIITARTAYL